MKVLIIEATQVNYRDDRGGVHEDAGNIIDVNKDDAAKLTAAGRALYVAKADDPFKDGRFTASAEMVKAAKDMATTRAAAAKAGEKKEPETPPAA